MIASDDGRVRLESDSAAWVVEASQRVTSAQPGKKTDPAVAEKTGKGPGESHRLSFSRLRAESPTREHKVELRGGNVVLIDLKNPAPRPSSPGMASTARMDGSVPSAGRLTDGISHFGANARCPCANTS